MAASDPRRDSLLAKIEGGIARLDPTSVDLTDLDLGRVVRAIPVSPAALAAKITELARDATYVTVGLGVLNFQRAQVRRRGIERLLRR